jgi:hypothetical protein
MHSTKALDHVSKSCYTCTSLHKVPHFMIEQSTSASPDVIGTSFAADVIKRQRQMILVVRETVTSFTTTCLISNERRETLRDALIQSCITIRPVDGPMAIVRVDPAPGFSALVKDQMLLDNRICVEIGRIKNTNKNPIAERAVQELEDEILRQKPGGGPITPITLARATARLNSRIRQPGISAWEMWSQRDQHTQEQLPISDRQLIKSRHNQRTLNHQHSEKSKAHGTQMAPQTQVSVGDLVYLYADRDKHCARSRYLVIEVDGQWCSVRKFSGTQLRSSPYLIKLLECYKVPEHTKSPFTRSTPTPSTSSDDEDYDGPDEHRDPPSTPRIPQELSQPADDDIGLDLQPPDNTYYSTRCKYPLRNRLRDRNI